MNDKVRNAAEEAAASDTSILAGNPLYGPASIEGYFDDTISVVDVFL